MTMTTIINLREEKPSDKHTQTILDKASANGLKGVLLLGYDDKGEVYIDTNIDDGGAVLWLTKQAEFKLILSGLPK